MGIIEQLAEIKAEEATAEAREKFVKRLLTNTEFSVNKIAELVEVPASFVKKVKANLRPKLQRK